MVELSTDPGLDLLSENGQGHAAAPEQLVVEIADVEPLAERLFCERAQASDLDLT
jgi:hypothetical protein